MLYKKWMPAVEGSTSVVEEKRTSRATFSHADLCTVGDEGREIGCRCAPVLQVTSNLTAVELKAIWCEPLVAAVAKQQCERVELPPPSNYCCEGGRLWGGTGNLQGWL